MIKNRGCVVALVLVAVLSLLSFNILDLFTDLAWFETLGVTSVFWKRLISQWLLC
jgi:uncharacterized membrane protein (UPF0182 family)